MTAEAWYNSAGTWRLAKNVWFNDAGVWRTAKTLWFNDAGVWRKVFSSGGLASPNLWCDITGTGITISPQVRFETDGTTLIRQADNTLLVGANWFNPTTVGAGNPYWIKVLVTTGTGTLVGLSPGVWYAMSAETYWGIQTASAGNAKSLNLNYYISTDSGGVTVVGGGTLKFTSDRT